MYKYLEFINSLGKKIKRPVFTASDFTYDEYVGVKYLETATFETKLPAENTTQKGWSSIYTYRPISGLAVPFNLISNTSEDVGVKQIFYQIQSNETYKLSDNFTIRLKSLYYITAEKASSDNDYFYFSVDIIPLIKVLDSEDNDILAQSDLTATNSAISLLDNAPWYQENIYPSLDLLYNLGWYVANNALSIYGGYVEYTEDESYYVSDHVFLLDRITYIAYDLIFKSNTEFTIKPKFTLTDRPTLLFYAQQLESYNYNQTGTPIYIGSSTDASLFYGDRPYSYDCLWFSLSKEVNLFESDTNETDDNDEVSDSAGAINSTGGGGGDFDDTSDPIDIPTPSTTNPALRSGLIRMWKISASELSNLVEFLWDDSVIATLLKLFSNPLNCICNLMTFPYNVSAEGSVTEIRLLDMNTGVNATPDVYAGDQIDCGSINVNEYFGNFLDYDTNVTIFLPFIGLKPLNINDVMDSNIHLVYNVDNQTGECVAFLKCNKFNQQVNSVLYSWTGNMGVQLPINARDVSTQYLALLNSAAQMTAGNYIGATNTFVNGIKPTIEKGGRMDSNAGNISVLKPYLIIERPIWQKPTNYAVQQGEISNLWESISSLTGFVKFVDINVESSTATDAEKEKIKDLLTEGIII